MKRTDASATAPTTTDATDATPTHDAAAAVAPTLDTERLAGLVFELASQLHAERAHRLALEHALQQAGIVTRAALESAASDAALRDRSRAEVEASVARLMRVVTENADPRAPLRERQGDSQR